MLLRWDSAENFLEQGVIGLHALLFQPAVFFNQFLAGCRQLGAFATIGLNDGDLQVLLGRLNFTPGRLVGHFQHFGRLVNGTGFFNALENLHAPFAHNDAILIIHNPLAGS